MAGVYYSWQDYCLGELKELLAELTNRPEEDFQELGFYDCLEEINHATDY